MLSAGASGAAAASTRGSQAPGASPTSPAAPPAALTGQHAGAARQEAAPLRARAAPAVGGSAPTGGRAAAHGSVSAGATEGTAPASRPAHAAGGARAGAAAGSAGPASGRAELQGGAWGGLAAGAGFGGALGGTTRVAQGSAPAASVASIDFSNALRRLAEGSAPAAMGTHSVQAPGSAGRAGRGSARGAAGAQVSDALRSVGSPPRAARHPWETAPGLFQAPHGASGDAGPEGASAATLRHPAAAAAPMLGQGAAGGGWALHEGERPGSGPCNYPGEGQGEGLSAQPCATEPSAAYPAGSCDPDVQPGGCSRMGTGASSDGIGGAAGDGSAAAAHASALSARERDSGAARQGPEGEGAARDDRCTADSHARRGDAPGMHHPAVLPYYEQVQTPPLAARSPHCRASQLAPLL